jgi:NADPH:quinone reductase-like Zn-dependent oxidoreductase
MKSFELKAGSTGLDGLHQVNMPRPEPGPGQMLVRLHAASLNFRDQAIASGRYGGGPVTRDTVPLSDGAGEVVELGAGVTRFSVGNRVAGTFFQGWVDGPQPAHLPALGSPCDGMLREYAVIDPRDAVAVPSHMNFEEAATLPCAGVTAWRALMTVGDLKPGQTVLVLGTGGVSLMALQLARAAGARVIVTSSSDDKIARAVQLGADLGVNYTRSPAWEQDVLAATDGRGVDCVVEVGGPGTLARSMDAIAHGGRIALIGVLAAMAGPAANPLALMRKGASLHGVFVGSRTMFEAMNAAMTVNRIHPVIDRVFAFDEAVQAYEYQQSTGPFGKVVIRI